MLYAGERSGDDYGRGAGVCYSAEHYWQAALRSGILVMAV